MREVVITAALPLVTNGLAFLAMFGVMLWINWKLDLIAFVTFPILLLYRERLNEMSHVLRIWGTISDFRNASKQSSACG